MPDGADKTQQSTPTRSPELIAALRARCIRAECWSWSPAGCSLVDCHRRATLTEAQFQRGRCRLGHWDALLATDPLTPDP